MGLISFTFPGLRRRGAGVLAVLFAVLPIAPAAIETPSFRNDVMAIISKAGCNAGACHGNANGKAGLKLSLRGEDPAWDYRMLTRDQFGRRINPFDPAESLILLKATTSLAHEGGKRFETNSWEYATLRQWIASGAPNDVATAPQLVRLEVSPPGQILVEPVDSVQLKASAVFSDGSRRDVSGRAVYETANSGARVSSEGLARRESFGETTVLVRYLNRQEPVRLAFVPARPGFQWKAPVANNFVDEHVFAKLKTLRMNASPVCSDEVFLRRAHLDLLGLFPTAEEARKFVADPRKDKRVRVIDQLLERPEFADYWALKWSDLLRAEERALDQKGLLNFHHWIRQSIAENKPLDEFVREMISARGSTYLNPAANFYRANRDPVTRAEAAAQVFLGTRLQCAQCHNHPFDRWTQDDYYNWAAVFAKVDYKVLQNKRTDTNDKHEFKGEQIVFLNRQGEVKNPRSGRAAVPQFLSAGAGAVEKDVDELEVLARWMTAPENPFFARSQVNRIWYHLMGRGIVDPIDDFRPTNPASHPALLEALAADFVRHKFDLRHSIRVIMASRSYQLSSEPNGENREDEINFSHAIVRRLTAEQMLDCESEVTGVPNNFSGYPTGLRAAELPGVHLERRRGEKSSTVDQFLQTFGKPPRLLTCECERSTETTMSQAFQLISGPTVNDLIGRPENRLAGLLSSGRTDRVLIDDLYWTALTRAPSALEAARTEKLLRSASSRRAALEDILWALLNSKEFLLRH